MAFPGLGGSVCRFARTACRGGNPSEEKGINRVRVAMVTILDTFGRYRRPAKILLVQAAGLGATFEDKRNEINDRFAYLIQTYLDESIEIGDIGPSIQKSYRLPGWVLFTTS